MNSINLSLPLGHLQAQFSNQRAGEEEKKISSSSVSKHSMVEISFKQMGSKKRLLEGFHIDWPPTEDGEGGDPLTLRQLITRIVLAEVAAFRKRQRKRSFVQVLSEAEIEIAAEAGKIDSGGRELDQEVDENEAVGVALQAFEDGIYLVLIDQVEQRNLDVEVHAHEGTQIVFLRLTFLAGA
ncbi:MAG: hypothetical protein L3J39_12115 [Verrucomicrobiales bacterium]|nr:hypothetical protein [Verrucomicrobiales bacterium]